MSLARGNLHVGDGLDPFKQSSGLSHCGDQMRSNIGSDALVLWSIRESVQVCHGNSHIGAWRLVDLPIPDHVESITEVVCCELPLLVRSPLSAIGVALLAELSLLVGFAIDNWFIIADVEDQISSPGGKTGKRENPEG